MIPVILSGGSGSRLWPLSRDMYPKQLLPLIDPQYSMLQQTLLRTNLTANSSLIEKMESAPTIDFQAPMIICNEVHRFMVGEQLQQLGFDDGTILLEPQGRNTAPAIALAAFEALQQGLDRVLLVMPSDHVIEDLAGFWSSLQAAEHLAKQGQLVTFGIVPSKPETGYGYIQAGEPVDGIAYQVAQFVEKPDLSTAEQYLKTGNYFWNGGIFMFTAQAYLEELHKYAPDVYQAAKHAMADTRIDLDFTRLNDEAFLESPSISIDYAVMENTDKATVLPLDVGWNDVGSWSALWRVSEKDPDQNVKHGDVLLHDTHNSYVYAETKLVSLVGIADLVVVETDDAVLVMHKDRAQDVKNIVEQLKGTERAHTRHHRKVYRPWGWYDSIDVGTQFQVKRIQVKPNAKLSVQMHQHRAEHWVVVKGQAEVLNGEQTVLLRENQSTYIPIGVKHSLRNPSDIEPLEIIEVQSGSYFGEDDIIRFEDDYGRN